MPQPELLALEERAFARFAADVRARRDCGKVHVEAFALRGAAADVDVLDAVAARIGGASLGSAWIPLGEQAAIRLLTRVLSRDMAYNAVALDPAEAQRVAARFLGFFGEDRRLYTNSTLGDESTADLEGTWTGGATPLTLATFECGVAVTDGLRAGILWVEDED